MFLLLTAPSAVMPSSGFAGLAKVAADRDVLPTLGCALVALVMLVCVVRWCVRFTVLRRAEAANEKFTAAFRQSAHALALYEHGALVPGSPRSALYTNACRELAMHLLGTDVVDKSFSSRLRAAGRITPWQWQATQRVARRSLEESARWFRSGLTGTGVKSLLGLGLFATLLGLMAHGGGGTLDGAAVASSLRPLALALVCHVIGMACHRALLSQVNDNVAELEDFSTELGLLFERSYVDYRQPIETLPSLGGMGMSDSPKFSVPPTEAVSVGMS
jgi:biopolymer transport protein ExbB/TolQ